MRVLLDMDGVIAEFGGGAQKYILDNHERLGIQKEHAERIYATEATCWSMFKYDWDLSFEQFDNIVRLATEEGFWATLEPIEGTLEGVEQILAAGHEIHVVSTPWGKVGDDCWWACANQKTEWLAKHGVRANTIRFGDVHKLDPDLHVAIDDKISTCVDFAAVGRYSICHARLHNSQLHNADEWQSALGKYGALGETVMAGIVRAPWEDIPGLVDSAHDKLIADIESDGTL